MAREVHSGWTKILVAALILVLAGSYVLPWYTYAHTTGPRHAPGYDVGNNTTTVRRHIDVYPGGFRGDYNVTDASALESRAKTLGHLVSGALAVSVLALVSELAGGGRSWGRYLGLSLLLLGALGALAALLYTWFFLPPALAQDGVNGAFTAGKWAGGYIRTTVNWGWALGAASIPLALAAAAFRFAAGAFDLAVMEGYHPTDRKGPGAQARRPPPKA